MRLLQDGHPSKGSSYGTVAGQDAGAGSPQRVRLESWA